MSSFSEADAIFHFLTVRWEPIDKSAGRREITWRWYINDKLIFETKQKHKFSPTPFEIQGVVLGTALGAGRGRVEVFIDGALFDTKEFQVHEQETKS